MDIALNLGTMYMTGVVCFLHFTDIALKLGTLRIVKLEQYVPALYGHSLKFGHPKNCTARVVSSCTLWKYP